MKHRAWTFALLLAPAIALAAEEPAMTVEEEARALINTTYTLREQGQRVSSQLSCTSEGGGILQVKGVEYGDWATGTVRCQERTVMVLKRVVGEFEGNITWRIVDTLLLPPYEVDPDPKNTSALELFWAGECSLDGRTDTEFIALVRLGKRDRINWRTGVQKAWTFDIKQGRIVPLSTKRIVCHRPEPA